MYREICLPTIACGDMLPYAANMRVNSYETYLDEEQLHSMHNWRY